MSGNPFPKSNESVFASVPGVILARLLAEHRAHIILGGAIWILLVVSLIRVAFNKRGR